MNFSAREFLRRPWPYLALALLLWAGVATWLSHEKRLLENQEFARELDILETAYRAAIEQHRLMAETLFDGSLRKPETLATIAAGADAAASGRDGAAAAFRGDLYRQLAPAYDRLQAAGVRQFQVFTADGKSFLRLHQPDRYGDATKDVRPSVRFAVEEKRPVAGFEVGRLVSGFRFVFPLTSDG